MTPAAAVFRANTLTHPNRARHDGRQVAEIVDHRGVSPALAALDPRRPSPADHVRYGVRFAGGSWDQDGSTWATPREIGRTT
jgi:hypothetical protein